MKKNILKNQNKGFSLLELLIVITIIAILISLILPNYMKARAQSLMASCKGNLQKMAQSVEMYSMDSAGVYPNTLDEIMPRYLRAMPTCPSSHLEPSYTYNTSATLKGTSGFTIWCCGPFAHIAVNLQTSNPYYESNFGLQPGSLKFNIKKHR